MPLLPAAGVREEANTLELRLLWSSLGCVPCLSRAPRQKQLSADIARSRVFLQFSCRTCHPSWPRRAADQPSRLERWGGLQGPQEGHRCVSRQPGVGGAVRAQGCSLDEDAVIGREGPEESQPLGGDHQELPFSPIPHPPLKPGPLPHSPSAVSGQQITPLMFPDIPLP